MCFFERSDWRKRSVKGMQSGTENAFRLPGQNCSLNVTSGAKIESFEENLIILMLSSPRNINQGKECQKLQALSWKPTLIGTWPQTPLYTTPTPVTNWQYEAVNIYVSSGINVTSCRLFFNIWTPDQLNAKPARMINHDLEIVFPFICFWVQFWCLSGMLNQRQTAQSFPTCWYSHAKKELLHPFGGDQKAFKSKRDLNFLTPVIF